MNVELEKSVFPRLPLRLGAFAPICLGCVLMAGAPCAAAEPPATDSAAASQPLTRSEVTGIIANARKIVSPHGIEELIPVQINGIPQYLSIRGHDLRNPVLLFIHGGPASPEMPLAYTFQAPCAGYFTGGEGAQGR